MQWSAGCFTSKVKLLLKLILKSRGMIDVLMKAEQRIRVWIKDSGERQIMMAKIQSTGVAKMVETLSLSVKRAMARIFLTAGLIIIASLCQAEVGSHVHESLSQAIQFQTISYEYNEKIDYRTFG